MIRVSTEFKFDESRWYVVGKPVFNSRYSSWRKNRFSLDNHHFHRNSISVNASPILGTSILTTWSK